MHLKGSMRCFRNSRKEATIRFSRRRFLKLGAAGLVLPVVGRLPVPQPVLPSFTMGVIADLHHGLAEHAMAHLETFMQAVDARKPDVLLQLGDFNFGTPESKECMDLWRQFNGARHHVLGNHDMDFTTKEEMLDVWEMPNRYYSFDRDGYHFVVLDRNNLKTPDGYVPYANANFYVDSAMRSHADPEQLEWLTVDLAETTLPTVIFVHQGLGMHADPYPSGDPRGAIEAVLEQATWEDGVPKVVACFCGHHHIDRYNLKKGIHYVWLNSASYYWVGDAYGRMANYKEALFSFLTFHPDRIEIVGRQTEWEAPDPQERGYPEADALTPYISDRSLSLARR